MHISIHVCMCVCMRVCMHMCMCTYILFIINYAIVYMHVYNDSLIGWFVVHVNYTHVERVYTSCTILFPRVVPAGTINFRLRDDAGAI